MMSMTQLNLGEPGAIVPLLHAMRSGVPIVEISGDENVRGIGSIAIKIDRLEVRLGRVGIPTAW